MANRSVTDILADLHTATAEELLKVIKSGEAAPGHFMAALRLLKDNGVDAVVKPGSPMADLAAIVPFPAGDTDYSH